MKKILVVDNDLIMLGIISRFLEEKGHEVLTAKNGIKALDILKTYNPDTIFIDLIMPNIDGELLCRAIRGMEKFKDVYLIILSAISAEEWVDINKFGANACIAKGPFDEMSEHITTALEEPEITSERCLSGEILGLEGVYPRGITEELLSVKKHFEVILDKMSDGIIEVNPERRVIYANSAIYSMIDIPEKNLLGTNFVDLFSGDEHKRVCDLMVKIDERTKKITKNSPLRLNEYYITLDIIPLDKDKNKLLIILSDVTEQHQAEDALRESEERFRYLSDAAYEAIIILKTGICVDVNNAAVNMFGLTRDEFIGSPGTKFMAPESIELLRQNNIQDIVLPYESIAQRKDGTKFSIEIQAQEFSYKGETVQVTAIRDITYNKQAEEALRESEEAHRTLVKGLPDIVMRLDGEGRHLFVSENVEDIVDIPSSKFIGKTHRELGFPEADCKLWSDSIRKVFNNGEQLEGELKYRGKRGVKIFNWRLLPEQDSNSGVNSVLSLSRDITDHRRAEKDYRTLFREMLNGFSLCKVICDAQNRPVDYRFISVNPAFDKMTGLQGEDVVGKTVLDVIPDADPFWINTLGRVALTGEPVSCEHYARGLGKYFEVTAFSPAPLHFACVFVDNTERNEMESRLQQSQKMEYIGTLAGGIAHDFNNILFPIMGFSEIMLKELPEDSSSRNYVKEILQGTIRARDLVKQILLFSSQSNEKLKPVKVQLIINEVLKLIKYSLPATIEIKQDINNNCGLVKADTTQIHQVAMNLITNSYQAMEDKGGILEVTLKEVELSINDLTDPNMTPGSYVCLSVADNGPGIDQSVMARIFEPYFTTKENGKGTGLGLAIVHGIVKNNYGDIRVYSESGQGTVFHIYLPLLKGQAETEQVFTTTHIPKGKERILIVDDEYPVVRVERQMLEQLGYDVTERTNSIEALKTFKAAPENFDLIITDMTMPNMTGLQLAKKIMEIRPETPIIICTGFNKKIDVKKATAAGISGFIMKPVVMNEFAKKIREVLD
ncbi:MAG: response regulator [Desulfobacteraceae bacterium]|jgi:two-component system, cell cycle sensor histidine kinase and response regulator CckA|nr:response regulator [Desulfobacteraceae bacterium]